ncbi:MAG TPA: hypothetical protein VJ548_15115, partial [Azospira sp.]|nr:hypothetical protein [Azospira sp.]
STISLYRRVAASDPSYPAVCSRCGEQSIADQSLLGSLSWIEVPALALAGVLWLLTNDRLLAYQIAVVAAVLFLPGSLCLVPLRPLAKEEPYPELLVTVVKPIFGPLAYVSFLVAVFSVLLIAAYVQLFLFEP